MRKSFFIKYGLWLAAILFLSSISDTYAQTDVSTEPGGGLALHVWDRYVRRFRRDHNLSTSIGYQSVDWDIQRFGDYTDRTYKSTQTSLVVDYTFHILLSGKTGYFLGSSFGYVYAKPDKIDDEFQPSTSWLLPGVRAGLAYNYDPSGRIFAGMGAQLERFNGLRTRRIAGDWQPASSTGESFQIYAGIDLFFTLDTAIHFTIVENSTIFQKPADAGDFLVNARMRRRAQGAELGLLIHFL
jgi:hypothetical protein